MKRKFLPNLLSIMKENSFYDKCFNILGTQFWNFEQHTSWNETCTVCFKCVFRILECLSFHYDEYFQRLIDGPCHHKITEEEYYKKILKGIKGKKFKACL